MMQIKLNGLDLMSGNYRISEHSIDDAPPVNISQLPFASFDGGKFISSRMEFKSIKLIGYLTGTTRALAEAALDTLKASVMNDGNTNLNFDYAGGYRQYIVNVSQFSCARSHANLTHIPFEITLSAADPAASEIQGIDSTTAVAVEAYSSGTYTGNTLTHTLTFEGSVKPKVIWTYVMDTVSGNSSQLIFKSKTTGRQLAVNATLTPGDTIVINEESYQVTLNNEEIDFSGTFPDFELGANEFQWDIYGVATGFVEDSSNPSPLNNTTPITTQSKIQTFTPAFTGQPKISLLLTNDAISTVDTVQISLWQTAGGIPTSIVETKTVTITRPFAPSWVDTIFATSLTAGTTYGVGLSSTATTSPYCPIASINKDVFTGGQLFTVYSGGVISPFSTYDMNFKLYINTSSGSLFDHQSDINVKYSKRHI